MTSDATPSNQTASGSITWRETIATPASVATIQTVNPSFFLIMANYPSETDNSSEATSYNGWTNYETWNVSLWIGNDEFLYNTAKISVKLCDPKDSPYDLFVRCMINCEREMTGDNVAWNDPAINRAEIVEMMQEL